jgi:hypothetical protein
VDVSCVEEYTESVVIEMIKDVMYFFELQLLASSGQRSSAFALAPRDDSKLYSTLLLPLGEYIQGLSL